VPFKGTPEVIQAMFSKSVDCYWVPISAGMAHIKSGKLRALAVTTAKRSSALPDVPTLDEAGLKGFNIGTWFGVLAPAATPKDILVRLNTEMVKVIQSPEFRKRMEEIGAEPIGNSADQMALQIKSETEKFAKLVKDAKVTIE
jgi:tripartite-type tricarboxylate transporter receptor subunit TctC